MRSLERIFLSKMAEDSVKKARQIKQEEVQKLSEKIADAKTIVFSDYHGLTAQQLTDLRSKIKAVRGELLISKNTLLKRALTSNQLPVTSNQLAGPTATVFAFGDEISPLKILAESAKGLTFPKFKFGFFGKNLLDGTALETLANIPPKQVLQANLIGALASPIYAVVSVLQANIRNLISVLDQATKKASSESASSV